jgi:single-strand DNA-binding protein
MARGINKVILIGNLGNDPDIKVASNTTFANLSIATDESYKDKTTGQMVPKTEWHKVIFSGKVAEICQLYLKKGSKIFVEGKLQTRKWKDQNGNDRYTTEIRGFEMQMLDSQSNNGQANNQQQAPQQGGYQQQAPQQPLQGSYHPAPGSYQQAPQQGGYQQQPSPNANNPQGYAQQQQQSYEQQKNRAPAGNDDFDDDIPY